MLISIQALPISRLLKLNHLSCDCCDKIHITLRIAHSGETFHLHLDVRGGLGGCLDIIWVQVSAVLAKLTT